METVLGSDVEPEMKERIIGQQLDALARAPVEMLQYYTCCLPYLQLMQRFALKGADKTTPRLIQFHTFKNAANPPFLGGFSIFSIVAA